MRNVAKGISTLIAAAVVASAVVVGLAGTGVAADEPARTKAPGFKAEDLNGDKVSLEDLLGKGPVIVDFWATWCKPCIKELPYMQRLHEAHSASGLQVVAVTIDSPKSQSQVKKFIATRGYTFRVLLDGDQEIFKKLQGRGSIPYVVVLDKDGFVHYQHTGYRPGDEKKLEEVVLGLLGVGPGEAGAPPADSGEATGGESGGTPAGDGGAGG